MKKDKDNKSLIHMIASIILFGIQLSIVLAGALAYMHPVYSVAWGIGAGISAYCMAESIATYHVDKEINKIEEEITKIINEHKED